MSVNEYWGWIAFFEEKSRKQEVNKGNLAAMTPEELSRAFPRG